MAHNYDADLAIGGLQLLQCRNDKHCSLAHTTSGLAHHIHAQDGLGDALILDWGGGGGGGRSHEVYRGADIILYMYTIH